MPRKRKPLEPEWAGLTRSVRTPPPTWANDGLSEAMPAGSAHAGWPVREGLLAAAMDMALAGQDKDELRWVLKQVVDHEIARIQAGPSGYFLDNVEMGQPATADLAMALLQLTEPDAAGKVQLRRWVVDRAPARQPQKTDLERKIERNWYNPMPEDVAPHGWR